jgi:hypothetical protein
MMRGLYLFAALLSLAAGDGGCDAPGFSWGTFFYPEGSVWISSSLTSSGCSGNPRATCAFSGPYSVPEFGSIAVTCPISSPGQFSVTAIIGGQSLSVSAPSGTCATALAISANIECKPGLLVFLIPVLLLLACIGGCCACCCCRARGGGMPAAAAPSYIMLTDKAPAREGFYAPPQAQQQPTFYLPPPQQHYAPPAMQ